MSFDDLILVKEMSLIILPTSGTILGIDSTTGHLSPHKFENKGSRFHW